MSVWWGDSVIMWQDTLIFAGSIVAIASLVPTITNEEAIVPHTTSVPTLVVLSGQGLAYYSLDLMGAAIGAAAGLIVWSLIAYYKAPEESVLDAGRERLLESTARVRSAVDGIAG